MSPNHSCFLLPPCALMLAFRSNFCLTTFTLFPHFLVVHSVLQQRTIDDEYGDSVTGDRPSYLPVGVWKQGATSLDGPFQPDPALAFQHTWHETIRHGDESDLGVQFTFAGTSLCVFCIVPNTPISDVVTSYSLRFRLDGQSVGEIFTHTPDSTSPFLYNVSVYSVGGLANTNHSFLMFSSANDHMDSVILFDYASYTFDDGQSSVPPPTITPLSQKESQPQICTPAPAVSTTSSRKLGTILGPIFGVLGSVLIIIAAYWILRKRPLQFLRRRDNSHAAHIIDPFEVASPVTSPVTPVSRKWPPFAGRRHNSLDGEDQRVSMRYLQEARRDIPYE